MDLVITIADKVEKEIIINALKCVDEIDKIIDSENISDTINEIKNGSSNTAVCDIESLRENILDILDEIKLVKTQNLNAKVILIANKDSDIMASAAFRFGINYVIIRPYDIDSLVKKIMDISMGNTGINYSAENKSKQMAVERTISTILNETGILPNLRGHKYLKDAITMGYYNRNFLEAVTKFLYPEIARNNNTTADRVERSIRHAIESAWNRCGGNGFYAKMGFGDLYDGRRPTNSEYIFTVVEYLNNHIS